MLTKNPKTPALEREIVQEQEQEFIQEQQIRISFGLSSRLVREINMQHHFGAKEYLGNGASHTIRQPGAE